MLTIIKTEFQKIKRYHILLIGIIGMFCSPLLQLFSQMAVSEEMKNPNFDFAALVKDTTWGNAQIFLPVIVTLIGGYLINREYTDDTLKNILTVPVSFRKLLVGKLGAIGLLAVMLGIYSLAAAVVVSICVGIPHISVFVLLCGLCQMTGLSLCVYIVVLPIIIICSRKPGLFMSGSVIAFLTGYCCLFFKQGLLRSVYPFSAALTVIGFDASDFTGATEKGSLPLALLSLGVMALVAVTLIWFCGKPGEMPKKRKNEKKAGGRSGNGNRSAKSGR